MIRTDATHNIKIDSMFYRQTPALNGEWAAFQTLSLWPDTSPRAEEIFRSSALEVAEHDIPRDPSPAPFLPTGGPQVRRIHGWVPVNEFSNKRLHLLVEAAERVSVDIVTANPLEAVHDDGVYRTGEILSAMLLLAQDPVWDDEDEHADFSAFTDPLEERWGEAAAIQAVEGALRLHQIGLLDE